MLRLVCFLFGHKPAPGVSRTFCWRFHCERCSRMVDGALAGHQ